MTFQQELHSWLSPEKVENLKSVPSVGSKAPNTSKLQLPSPDGKPTIVTFLRHCGCPFAEKTFKNLIETAAQNKSINCIAISHSSQEATDEWVTAVGGQWDVKVIVDAERKVYAEWGLGVSSAWHVLNPQSLYSAYKLGKQEGIWNRPTESGSRWQTSGSFAVDKEGIVRWKKVSNAADDVPNFEDGVETLA